MSTYEQLRGARLKFLDQDPANASNGQVWYNSTTGKDRVQGIGTAAWSSGANLAKARGYLGGVGTPTAALAYGGAPGTISDTEEYNGTGWQNSGSMGTGRFSFARAGTQTAALAAGGEPPTTTATEEYDGSTWTAGTALPSSNRQQAGFGTQTAGVSAGGNPGGTSVNRTEEYDGSAWATGGNLSQPVRYVAGSGTLTSGLVYVGYSDSPAGAYATAQHYDGSSWTTGGALNTARHNGTGTGPSDSDALAMGGSPYRSIVEQYDGTAWTEVADMATGRNASGSSLASPTSASIIFGGNTPPYSTATEEYNFSTVTKNPAAWSAGTNWPGGAGMHFAGTGTQTAYLKSSGNDGTPPTNPISNNAYEFDGSSWTSAPSVPYESRDPDSAGLQTAAIQFGGQGPTAAVSTSTEYDGSSWTGAPSMNHNRRSVTGAGLQTTAITAGGAGPPSGTPEGAMTNTESYNGSTWSNEAVLPAARTSGGTVGSEPAALRVGGSPTASIAEASVEYNGSTWTAGGNVNTPRGPNAIGASGTLTAGIIYGSPGTLCATETYDGTSFVTDAAMANPTDYRGTKNSPATTGVMAVGGSGPAPKVEEYTAESADTTNPAQSLTTSS